MAKNRWYGRKEDAYIRRRTLELLSLPYGRRTAAYKKIAWELYQKFGTRRTWQGVQQRTRNISEKEE